MGQHEFDITIEPNGHVGLSIKGFKGKGCHDAVKLFEKIVGELKSQQATSEFYEPEELVRFQIDQRH
jgi:hypothetical protein